MKTLAAFLMAMVKPLLQKIFLSLGLGIITYASIQLAFDKLVTYTVSSISSLPPETSAILGLAGIDIGLGLILGAVSFVISMTVVSKIGMMNK
ncbi:DUF2523 domain-containing protein [Chromobacterium haemolyticum]|uniref:DUF2523 domain-containing protein n=1 Tax=Chromobacterium haemolyticum TaxID=394935 RepID=UPI0013167272|nr:DUF2523 domain-containing protein [Chromobacterium haemolyticum]BBH12976.1 hypothetical protein CH06BL_22240 [Chromobacterium haemolyticum]